MNIRAKGANGEREVYNLLNPIIKEVMLEVGGFSEDDLRNPENFIQRNQNQSAVGGKDLVNTFGLAIEVKRQETLLLEPWWKQTVASAKRLNEKPVLLYRQNRKKWRAVLEHALEGFTPCNHTPLVTIPLRIELSESEFLVWFRNWTRSYLIYHK